MKITTLIFLLLLITLTVTAQQKPVIANGKITGRIVDSASRQPIGFATVSLKRADDKKIINGASANDKGFFTIDSVPNGSYTAIFDFIGYRKLEKKDIVISDKIRKVAFGDILLSEKNNELGTVNVTSNKSVIENKADMIVFNVDKDVTSQGGFATDVLKKIPQVSVDIDGNVEVQGNGNVLFLINGKPSTIFGNNLTDVLQSIPSSEIEKIEVITSPGAKYDADGTGGIINIILKKSQVQGINGNFTGSLGTRQENGSFNLNARKGNFGGHAWVSGSESVGNTQALTSLNRKTTDIAAKTINTLIQNGQSRFFRGGYQTGIGFDWDITPNDNISLTAGYDFFTHVDSGTTSQQSLSQGYTGNVLQNAFSTLDNSSSFGSRGFDYSVFYKHKFGQEKQELNILFSSSNSWNFSNYMQSQNSANNDTLYSGTKGSNPGSDREYTISADYTQPVNKDIAIETGLKTDIRKISNNSEVYILNVPDGSYQYNGYQSNALTYNRNVYAAYLSGNFTLWNVIKCKAGLRYEQTVTHADFGTGGPINIPDNSTWAPSFVAAKDIGHGQTLKISYNHRIERPSYRVLNPFVNATDPKNITTGNPDLSPEISDKIETGYNKSFDKGSNINIALFGAMSNHDIQPYITYYPTYHPSMRAGDTTYTNVALTQYANVGLEERLGLSLSGSVPITSKLNVRGNMMVFDNYIINQLDPGLNSNGVDYRINFNASYQFDSSLIGEAYGNFNSARSNIQGKTASWNSYTIALRKLIFHKNGSIGLTVTDPFNEYVVMTSTLAGPNFSTTNTRKVPYRSFGISFTYKFGKLEFKKEKPEEENNDNPEGN